MKLLERAKTYFVFTTLALAQKWVDMCTEWLEDRQKRSVKRAEEITNHCGFINGKLFKLKSEDK